MHGHRAFRPILGDSVHYEQTGGCAVRSDKHTVYPIAVNRRSTRFAVNKCLCEAGRDIAAAKTNNSCSTVPQGSRGDLARQDAKKPRVPNDSQLSGATPDPMAHYYGGPPLPGRNVMANNSQLFLP